MIKYTLRLILIISLGLIITCIVYTTLHEIGHVLTAYALGVEIKELRLIHPAYVMVNQIGLSREQFILIGISGNIFPTITIFSILLVEKLTKDSKIWNILEIWYSKTFLLFSCTLSYILSIINIVIYIITRRQLEEDISMIINKYPESIGCVVVLMGLLGLMCTIIFIKQKPITTFINYLEEIYDRSIKE